MHSQLWSVFESQPDSGASVRAQPAKRSEPWRALKVLQSEIEGNGVAGGSVGGGAGGMCGGACGGSEGG